MFFYTSHLFPPVYADLKVPLRLPPASSPARGDEGDPQGTGREPVRPGELELRPGRRGHLQLPAVARDEGLLLSLHQGPPERVGVAPASADHHGMEEDVLLQERRHHRALDP